MYDDEQILDLLRRTQELEKQKVMFTGVILIVMGIALQALSHTFGGSDIKDFFSGASAGAVCRRNASGIYVTAKGASGSSVFLRHCICRKLAVVFHSRTGYTMQKDGFRRQRELIVSVVDSRKTSIVIDNAL